MDYNFFDYKYDIEGFDSDLFSATHIVFIILAYCLTFLLSFLFRKARHRRIDVGLKVLSIVSIVLELTKITWESYHDITTGHGFNWVGILPVYTCSLFLYTLLFAAWTRGRARRYCLSFLTTIGLLFGAIGVVYCNGLNFYPFWTFGAFYSLFFHTAMFSTGVFLLSTGYYTLEWRDALRPMVPILLLALVAIPINHVLGPSGADYMLIYSGSGVPLYEPLAAWLAERGLRFVYTGIMLLTHIPLALLVIAVYQLIARLAAKRNVAANRRQAPHVV